MCWLLALNNREDVSLWPFDGELNGLLQRGKIVVAETYPGECYCWFLHERLQGKGQTGSSQSSRAAPDKMRSASLDLALEPALLDVITKGFPEGE